MPGSRTEGPSPELEPDQLRALQLDAIRPLAGGLSHELNNILNVILAFGQGLAADLAADEQLSGIVQEMMSAAQRGTQLTQQLLAFSQQLFLQPRLWDLDQIVGELEPAARELTGDAIEFLVQRAPSPCPCRVDRRQLERALVSLLASSVGDMSAGGRVVLDVRSVDGGPLPLVRISIADTGRGMSADEVARLFEPFYSSKQLGKGVGLGLAAAHGAVRQCGGWIEVDSAPGIGTVFLIYFPRAAEGDTPAQRPVR